MIGSVTKKQRWNRILHYREFRLYKLVWKRLDERPDIPISLPYFIEKFGSL